MPFLDVTDLFFDPMIAGEKFNVVRRQESINPFGEGVLTLTTYENIKGQVAPYKPFNLNREAAYTTQEKTLQVITTFKLFGASKDQINRNYQPDLIFWKNDYYIVSELEDYSQYGAGFVSAICTAFDWTIEATAGPTGTNFGLDFKYNYNSANIVVM